MILQKKAQEFVYSQEGPYKILNIRIIVKIQAYYR